jgi:pimeloyl-ACP methyl ester carboxylesterase
MSHAQMPIAGATFGVKLKVAAWHDKPSYAVIATDDRALDTERAKWMAQRAGSKVTLVKASHAVLITQPRVVAGVIEAAARAAR